MSLYGLTPSGAPLLISPRVAVMVVAPRTASPLAIRVRMAALRLRMGLFAFSLRASSRARSLPYFWAMKSKGLPLSHRTKRLFHLGSAKSASVVGQFLLLHQLGVVHDTEDAIEIEQTRRVLRRPLAVDSVELRKLVARTSTTRPAPAPVVIPRPGVPPRRSTQRHRSRRR